MVTSVLSAVQKVYSGARKNLTLASMNYKYSRALSGKGSGVGRVHISRFTTPSDAQAILTRVQYIKEGQKDLQRQKPSVKLPTIHAPRANLSGLNLSQGSDILERANLKSANLERANLSGVSLKEANLKKANLYYLNANHAQFDRANLTQADLNLSQLQYASFEDSRLQDTLLFRANLQQANLKGTNLKRALLDEANLESTNLQQAKLNKARLSSSNLNHANLRESDLQESNLERSLLHKTDLTAANLKKARFTDAVIDEKRIKVAQNSSHAQLPEYFTPERSGYAYEGGSQNLGVKIGDRFVTKRISLDSQNQQKELANMIRIEERLEKLAKTDPVMAETLRAALVRYRASFTDPKNPKHQYIVMDKANGTPLEAFYNALPQATQDSIDNHIDRQNDLFVKHLGFYLDDRHGANMFVEMDGNQIKLSPEGLPFIHHIDYGMVTWDDDIRLIHHSRRH